MPPEVSHHHLAAGQDRWGPAASSARELAAAAPTQLCDRVAQLESQVDALRRRLDRLDGQATDHSDPALGIQAFSPPAGWIESWADMDLLDDPRPSHAAPHRQLS